MSFFSEYNAVFKLLKEKQQVVFYSEGRHYYQYFEKLIDDLLANDVAICYLTSESKDPLLKEAPANMKVIHVKWLLGFLFSKIKADVMIMTMPDLGSYLFKRSAAVGTYVYMFHAAVSTHQQYRKSAFFRYDAIFCTGSYQKNEIRNSEAFYGLRTKELIEYGYPLFDKIRSVSKKNSTQKQTILIAPSWFDGCIFDTCIEELLNQLSKLDYEIILRSHPEYEKRKKKAFNKIKQLIKTNPRIQLDTLPNVLDRLPSTDILITDRSGIALEFAFGIQKPVLFIDTDLKINNRDYAEIDIEPIENSIRSEIGISLKLDGLNLVNEKLGELEMMKVHFPERITALFTQTFYNNPVAYKKGLDYVLSKIRKD